MCRVCSRTLTTISLGFIMVRSRWPGPSLLTCCRVKSATLIAHRLFFWLALYRVTYRLTMLVHRPNVPPTDIPPKRKHAGIDGRVVWKDPALISLTETAAIPDIYRDFVSGAIVALSGWFVQVTTYNVHRTYQIVTPHQHCM